MIRRFIEVLYGRTPETFRAVGSPEEAVRALNAATPSGFLGARHSAAVVGSVSASRVVLRYSRPFFSNGFAPVFRGQFSVQEGRAVLHGHFALPLVAQGFMTLWFGGAALFSLGSLVVGPIEAARSGTQVSIGLLAGIAMFVAGVLIGLVGFGVVVFSKRLARGDAERIALHIRSCLGTAAA